MSPIFTLIALSLIGGFVSLAGSWLLLWRADSAKKIITPLLAFAAGAFLSAAFLDVLPEALEAVEEPHPILTAALVGFLIFFALERFLMRYTHKHSEHSHGDHTESLPFLLILGDSLHNFLDGIVIALSFLANPVLGLATTLAVAAHEIPQEIGDAIVLLNQGWSKTKIILVNIGQSLLTIPGVLLGYYAGQQLESSLPILLAGAGGVFIYLAASDIIPEIHHQAGHKHVWRVILPMLASILIVGYLVALAHGAE